MQKMTISVTIFLFLFIISQPILAGDLLEQEVFEVSDAWLVSDPQPGVDYHVLRVCQDEDMSIDCTQCIYKAKSDGALQIPANNRCIFRVKSGGSYSLFFQIKASTVDGLESEWTTPRLLTVHKLNRNSGVNSIAGVIVSYETQDVPEEE